MFFDEGDDAGYQINPEIFHLVRRELNALNSNLTLAQYGLRNIPTHTEDGIPIRKLYVSNLPYKATRTELFGVFAQYGFIKSCWVRMGDKGPNRSPVATYAFVTFSDPADAHKALKAPMYEKTLRGRQLRISPADSWHQPSEDPDGRINWKPQQCRREEGSSTPNGDRTQQNGDNAALPEPVDAENSENTTEETDNDTENDLNDPYTMLDILNIDCLHHILSYLPVRDLIRSERVSKSWQNMVQEYMEGIRMFKTSWWQQPVTLTTAVLRRVLQRLGGSLLRLHIDHHWSALNDRTAHTVGKFCPHLEELKVVGMHTKNWNPLIYGCKNLKSLSFVSCNKLTDSSLVHLVKKDSCIESIAVKNNTHVTGLFLTGSKPPKLSSLEFHNCYSLQGTVINAAIDSIPKLITLKLDVCSVAMWKMIPSIVSKLPKLRELSLSDYTSVEMCHIPNGHEAFCKSLACLTELKVLNLSRNIYISNAVLKTVSRTCVKLESLNISSCNSRKSFPHPGVGDEGVMAVCSGCTSLESLDVSYLAGLSDAGLRTAARLPRLLTLTSRGNPALSTEPFIAVLASCHLLKVLGDEGVPAVCSGCTSLESLDVSYLAGLSDAGLRTAARLPRLLTLTSRGNPALSTEPFIAVLASCHLLKVLGDEGVPAVCSGCTSLESLDVSYLAGLSDAGLRTAARLPRLLTLTSRGNPALSTEPFIAVLASCHLLKVLGDEGVPAVCSGCTLLKSLDVSYLAGLSDAGSRTAARLPRLLTLTSRGNPALSTEPLIAVLASCHLLKVLGDEGVPAVCSGCTSLESLDVSYLAGLSDAGLRTAARLPRLLTLTSRGNPALCTEPFIAVLASCHLLKEIDVCCCENVSSAIVVSACEALRARPRPLTLFLAGTAAHLDSPHEPVTHKLLAVNLYEDRSNPHLRADFVDCLFDDSSDGSFDDIYDHDYEDFGDFLGADDDLFLDDDDDDFEDYEDVLQIHGANILLL